MEERRDVRNNDQKREYRARRGRLEELENIRNEKQLLKRMIREMKAKREENSYKTDETG